MSTENWRKYYDGVKASELTDADRELGLRLETRRLLPYDRFYRSFAPNCTPTDTPSITKNASPTSVIFFLSPHGSLSAMPPASFPA